jgi:hypothetical protein
MRVNKLTAILKTGIYGATVLLLTAGMVRAQQQVNLTAGPTSTTLPDGASVPMWGYRCGLEVLNSTAKCAPLNPTAANAGLWSPVMITVPTGQDLQINLTNHLQFGPNVVSANKIPTSIVIVGQIGGGLGDGGKSVASPSHDNQGTTWPIANTGPAFTPPAQGPRVQSFSTEVLVGGAISLNWTAPAPGTYLLESGTHPSIQATMGLIGMVVVTSAPSGGGTGAAYPGVNYSAEVPLIFSEIDPAQNAAVMSAVNTVGFKESAVRGDFGGPVSYVAITNGGSNYTVAPTVTFSAGAPSAVGTAVIDTDKTSPTYKQVIRVDLTNAGVYASTATVSFSGGDGTGALGVAVQSNVKTIAICSDGASACYPPVVNYSPRYYLINGAAFDKTNGTASAFAATQGTNTGTISGSVLVRMVNAGSRMHIPAIVGSTTGMVSGTGGFGGLSLIAEDGNLLPGKPRVQSEVFLAAGKTYDVTIDTPPASGKALAVFDRQLSLSANGLNRDAGMLGYISVNGATLPVANGTAKANPDTYAAVVAGQTLAISDPSKGVIANDANIFSVKAVSLPTQGTLNLSANGTFTYAASSTWNGPDSFTYCGNGATSNGGSTTGPCTTVTLNAEVLESASGITCTAPSYTSNLATSLKVSAPGVLANCKDAAGYPLTVTAPTAVSSSLNLSLDANGGFTASVPSAGAYNFTFSPKNSQGVVGNSVTVNLTFPQGSGLKVTVLDGADKTTQISDYRWIIEEDRTFFVDPKCAQNPSSAGCPGSSSGVVPNFGTNFHTSYMPIIATGCTGDISCTNNQTVLGQQVPQKTFTKPSDVPLCTPMLQTAGSGCLDPNKRYYISVLPGDAAQPFIAGYAGAPDCSAAGVTAGSCGHGMGGAPIAKGAHDSSQSILVLTEPSPYPPATLTVFVFEDDYPLNGEHDAGGGVDILSPNEPGLGGFQITLQDDAGGTGDATGTPTYDMFNMPLSNSLAGTIDPVTGKDACPLSTQVSANATGGDGTLKGIVGMIITCPTYESDGKTLSPLAGQAVVKNLYQGRYGVVANPGADRIARGEEWLQTNTLDGQKAHDSFMRIGEPGYFQEFGPAGYHVTIGFANPKVINDRGKALCSATGADCAHEVKGHISTARMSRTPDERLYGSGTHDAYSFTQCYVSIGDPDGAEFGLTKCDADGNFDFPSGTVPAGNWKITTFDQWNDQVVDGITTAVGMCDPQSSISPGTPTNCKPLVDMGEVAVHQWQSNIYTRTFLDKNGDGVSNVDGQGNPTEPGLPLVATNIRFRDGSFSNFNNTDLNGYAGFNEVFPLFNWYVLETDSTRYKNTGTHVVYDSGGPVDGSAPGGVSCSSGTTTTKPCGNSNIASNLANTYEPNPLPGDLSILGAVYCADADCTNMSIASGPIPSDSTKQSTGRIDPPWVTSYGWQGYSGQSNFLEFGKKPFAENENGGIHGHVVYASTRPFDDPQLLLQTSWEPLVPHVRINLYKEGIAADGVTQTLTLIDHTDTTSFDDWAQGFRPNGIPNMNCPGQGTDTSLMPDPYFWFALKDQPQWLDLYNNNGTPTHTLPHNSQYKCYDGMHNWNQLQPAPYDGMYSFPSVTSLDSAGKPFGTNCTGCIPNPDKDDPYRFKTSMLPDGKYVVEVVVPPGYELVKEEDKNILIGDNFIAPVSQQFGGLGSIFILPDQAEVAEAYNSNNPQNPTDTLGRNSNLPSHEGDTGSVESFWPCVGEQRVVPDFISLFPGSLEVAPFAGATRPLCDRKEVTLTKQTSALAKFYIFTETHTAAHFTGVITDDFTAEFDPYSPQFGEKFAPAYLPVSFKDWAGNEINRVYSDAWGAYNGLNYSTWEVNPPNPTGYGPTMMVGCMNDGMMPDPNNAGKFITDPLFQAGYSDFCYELPFMPAQTGYFDTPVVPTSAFAGGYNTADCSYPDATPGILSAIGQDGVAGPWVSAAGHQLVITALGDQLVDNYGYSGPQSKTAPYNQQKITRHYSFGSAPTDFSSFPKLTSGTYSCNSNSSTAFCPYATIGGNAMTAVSWSAQTITGNAPTGVAACPIQQQLQYGGSLLSPSLCGELVITATNGKQSVDTVTVTIGGKKPTVLANQTIQNAIDLAAPGDMIIVPPGTYSEMVLMWKPVRLQGVGAASSIIDANPHPAGKLDPWRRQVDCLFGLALNGQPYTNGSGSNPYDSSSTFTCPGTMKYFSGGPNYPTMVVDRIPMEGTLGWDTTVNGNLAEQLIEPSLMGAYEGAGITVLAKGVFIPAGATDVFGSGAEAAFPTGSRTLTALDCITGQNLTNPYPSNFLCNPSSIDGLTVKNSSQGGGGIFVHGWAHDIQIANNRVFNNQGTMSGGITIGQGEHPDVPLVGGGAATIPPGSCIPDLLLIGKPTNLALPYCYDMDVNIHNNQVVQNSSLGDELFSSTPAGGGGVTICNGSDYYKFNFNWVCGNMSTGDGAGVVHLGFSYDGDIEHNTILFNQSTNPTIVTNGGGLLVMGAPDPDPPCSTNDQDCVSAPGSITPSDGIGPGLLINANLIRGNSADSGSGGGLRLQHVNGTDVLNFPNGTTGTIWPDIPGHTENLTSVLASSPRHSQSLTRWNQVSVTNNIISNNVAGWDGGGVSLLDALAVNIVNNTIVSNNSTATSGVLFQTLFAPLASTSGANCTTTLNGAASTGSCPRVAGLVSVTNSAVLTANISQLTGGTSSVRCPANHGTNSGSSTSNCTKFSVPILYNDVFWQNRPFMIGVGGLGAGLVNQQNVVGIYDPGFTANALNPTPAASQTATGSCNSVNASYWDIGVRGDTRPGDHTGGTLSPMYSVLTNTGALSENGNGTNNLFNPASVVNSTFCNGSRVPVESGGSGWQVPPGTNESNALPAPPFTLLAAATVDEGNNWINLRWGPLSMVNPGNGAPLGDPALSAASAAFNYVPSTSSTFAFAPAQDFFGNPRPDQANTTKIDVGAIELQVANPPAPTLASISPNSGLRGASVPVTLTGTNLTGTSAITVSGTGVTVSNLSVVSSTSVTATFAITSTATVGARTVSVSTPGGNSNNVTFTVTAPPAPTLTAISPTSGLRGGAAVNVTLTGTNLTGATSISAGTGITVSTINVVSPTSVTATFTIASGTALGARNVTITTPGGTSNSVTFTVQGGNIVFSAPNPTLAPTGTATTSQKNGTITVTNNQTTNGANVTLTSAPIINPVGTQRGTFSIQPGGTCANGTVLQPNSANSCTINVRYQPTTTATSSANVSVTATGAQSATVTSSSFNGN